jgi:hypothetical protein
MKPNYKCLVLETISSERRYVRCTPECISAFSLKVSERDQNVPKQIYSNNSGKYLYKELILNTVYLIGMEIFWIKTGRVYYHIGESILNRQW